MPLPEPIPGLVIRYSYLWYAEQLEGREEGTKERPCAIVAAVRSDPAGNPRLLVLPVTHAPPDRAEHALEIPLRVKERLGLDADRSWIIVSEWNEFTWPGPDLARIRDGDEASVAYGMLPPALFASVRSKFLALVGVQQAHRVRRSQ